jgi:hypothetical protein
MNQKEDLRIYLQWILHKKSVETVDEDAIEGRLWADVWMHSLDNRFADTHADPQIIGVCSETSLSLTPLHGGRRDNSAESGDVESELWVSQKCVPHVSGTSPIYRGTP